MEKVKKTVKVIGLDLTINELQVKNTTHEVLEQIDNDLTYILNIARKFIERPIRKVLYFKAKLIVRAKVMY